MKYFAHEGTGPLDQAMRGRARHFLKHCDVLELVIKQCIRTGYTTFRIYSYRDVMEESTYKLEHEHKLRTYGKVPR